MSIEPLQVKIKRAAELLDYSERTIYRLIDAGELDAVGSGTRRRIPVASIHAYMERNRGQGGDHGEGEAARR
jgi:excisionase family DNA binding protein